MSSTGAWAEPRTVSGTSVAFTAGASVDNGGLNFGVGLRQDLSRHFLVGVDAEYNPWFNILNGSVQIGAANVFVSAAYRWLDLPGVELRTTVEGGATLLLFELYGPHAGALGAVIGGSVVNVGIRLSPRWKLVVKPDLILLIPQLRGTPLIYHEYRLTFELEHLL